MTIMTPGDWVWSQYEVEFYPKNKQSEKITHYSPKPVYVLIRFFGVRFKHIKIIIPGGLGVVAI